MNTISRKKDKQFHFKQFSVRHDRSGMKVGTDGVLLGAWVNTTNAKLILDIGTGTGVIALMMAQRTPSATTIEAIEMDEPAFQDAAENFASSPWRDRLMLHHGLMQGFASEKQYDLIVSNPPYFINGYKPPNDQRIVARHSESMSFQDLLNTAKKFIAETGRLSVILPVTEGLQFLDLAAQSGFHCSRKWSFRTRKEKPVERFLLEFSRIKSETEEGEILLYRTGEEWSDGYRSLTGEFYLKI